MKPRARKITLKKVKKLLRKQMVDQYERDHAHSMLVTYKNHGIELTDKQLYYLIKTWRPEFDNLKILKILKDIKYTREYTLDVNTPESREHNGKILSRILTERLNDTN